MRRALYEIFLFLLPFALYFLYTRVAPRDEEGALRHAHPWLWLFVSGLVLAIIGFIWVGVTQGAGSQGNYIPAHQEDGHLTPGHFGPPVPPVVPTPPPLPAPGTPVPAP